MIFNKKMTIFFDIVKMKSDFEEERERRVELCEEVVLSKRY